MADIEMMSIEEIGAHLIDRSRAFRLYFLPVGHENAPEICIIGYSDSDESSDIMLDCVVADLIPEDDECPFDD